MEKPLRKRETNSTKTTVQQPERVHIVPVKVEDSLNSNYRFKPTPRGRKFIKQDTSVDKLINRNRTPEIPLTRERPHFKRAVIIINIIYRKITEFLRKNMLSITKFKQEKISEKESM